jgi:nitrite reductase (NADH) small subunit
MAEFKRIGSKGELPAAGEAREFQANGKPICVANIGGTISAMENSCLHRGGPLSQGVIDGNKVVCPWHGWAWDVTSGEAAHNPAAKIKTYAIKIEGDDVLVEI